MDDCGRSGRPVTSDTAASAPFCDDPRGDNMREGGVGSGWDDVAARDLWAAPKAPRDSTLDGRVMIVSARARSGSE
jgi:hypothetical protein